MRPSLSGPIAAVVLALTAACGGDAGVPPTAVPRSLSIEGPGGALFLDQSYQFVMDARMSDGTRVTTGGTWGSDAPAVATVDQTGLVRVASPGDVTIFVDFQGQRATRRLRATVRYEGLLSTSGELIRCEYAGHSNHRCSALTSDSGYFGLVYGSFEQDGLSITAFMQRRWDRGTYGIEEVEFPPVTATVAENGQLRIEATIKNRYDDPTVWSDWYGRWILTPMGNGKIGGTHVFRTTVSSPCCSGYQEFEVRLAPVSIVRPQVAMSTADRPPALFALLRLSDLRFDQNAFR